MISVEYIREKYIQQTQFEHLISPPPTPLPCKIVPSPSRIEKQRFQGSTAKDLDISFALFPGLMGEKQASC